SDREVGAPEGGLLSNIAHGDGADVKVGEVLAVIEEDGGRKSEVGAEAAKRPSPADAPSTVTGAKADHQPGEAESAAAKMRATPAAKNVAQQNAVDLKKVQGTGDAGRVMRRDVESAFVPKGASAGPAPVLPRTA